MVKLGEIYSNVKNPLDNEEMLRKIVLLYSKSNRTNLYGTTDLYSSLVKMNQTNDSSRINLDDKETFFVKTYNQWIENMLNLDEAHIQDLESRKGADVRKMQQYLKSFGKVSSMDDIMRLKSNPLFDKEINGWEAQDGWDHILSEYISGRTESKISVKHRLYVGCQNRDMWKLAQLFKSKCEESQIPFYFKVGSSSERDDKMVIYSDTDNLRSYIIALKEIAQENPEIIQRCGEPPALTGKIDGWIGIGDEPQLKESGKKKSYNTLRACIFENAIEETLISDIIEFKGKDVIYNGKKIMFNNLFLEQAAQYIIYKLNEGKDGQLTKLSKYGIKEEELSDSKFKEYIKAHLKKNIQSGLNKLIEVKDQKEQLAMSNAREIFSIPMQEGKKIEINTYDMDTIIKNMIPIMQEIDPTFMDKVKSQIKEKCSQNGIDDTFCFQQGSKERFEKIDSAQSDKIEELESSKISDNQITKKENETSTSINSIDIVDILNPELLKQKIELPNGVKIPARQYIIEMVAPNIPSNGMYILSNGLQVPAKQYIEEFILGEGQSKYKGDIHKLLRENTRSNDGTIIVDGKKIKAVEIVNNIGAELMERKVKLPNGVEIPATQYIQEVVAPHIPYDGKFILKSNGLGIPAKQFIEEAVMFECQEKYNGDINDLLEAMTVKNNGTITVEKRTKKQKELKQEMEISNEQTKELNRQSSDERIQIDNVMSAVLESKVTTSEIQKQTKAIDETLKIKRLMFKQKSGASLTKEEKMLIEQHIRQTNEAQIRFRNQKKQKKSKDLDM